MLSRAVINDDGDGNTEIPMAQLHPLPSPHMGAEGSSPPSPVSIYALATLPAPETGLTCANLSLKVRGAGWVAGPEPAG